jgi:hypothetical protein
MVITQDKQMSSLPQRFPNLFTLRVELQRLPERVSGTLVVMDIEKNINTTRRRYV